MDLIPIQLFGLSYFFYVGVRHFRAPGWQVVSAVAAFFLVRQAWFLLVPRGALGGGITHIPTLVLLALCAMVLRSRGDPLERYLWLGCATYVTALMVRSLDLPLCHVLPIGVHWIWHLLTAATVGILLTGIVCAPPMGLRVAGGERG